MPFGLTASPVFVTESCLLVFVKARMRDLTPESPFVSGIVEFYRILHTRLTDLPITVNGLNPGVISQGMDHYVFVGGGGGGGNSFLQEFFFRD